MSGPELNLIVGAAGAGIIVVLAVIDAVRTSRQQKRMEQRIAEGQRRLRELDRVIAENRRLRDPRRGLRVIRGGRS